MDLRGRSFLKEADFTRDELGGLVDLAAELKAAKRAGTETQRLAGKAIALAFEKTSTRTRNAFEVAGFDQGAHVTYIDPSGSQMGHKESIADTARVLGRMYDALGYRGAGQERVEELAAYAGVPVYNGLTDEWHPTQMLADLLTMREHADGRPFGEIAYAFVGDGRFNMGRSLLVTGAIVGADVRIVTPPELRPPDDVVALAESLASGSGARITLTGDPEAGVAGADFVHTDIWVSMGEPRDVWVERARLLAPFRVDAALMAATGKDARFMHCLPAYHDANTVIGAEIAEATGMTDGLEVSHEVFESPASVVFDQAENRLHTIKALLVATLG